MTAAMFSKNCLGAEKQAPQPSPPPPMLKAAEFFSF
jgi:hypothetical protein